MKNLIKAVSLTLLVPSLALGGAIESRAAVSITCAEFSISISFSGFTGQNVTSASVSFVSGSLPSYSGSITKYKLRWVGTGTNSASEYTHTTFVDATVNGPHSFTSIATGRLNKDKTYQFFLDPYADTSTRANSACVGTSATQVNTSSTKLGLTQSGSTSVASGALLATQPEVSIQNSADTTMTDDTTPVTVAISGGDGNGTLNGTTTSTPVSGVASFSGLAVNGTDGQSYTLTYTAGSLTQTSQNVSVSTGAATVIALVAGDNQRAAARSTVGTAPQVVVEDSGGNPVSGTLVSFSIDSGGGNVGSASVSTAADGTASTSWTLGRSGGTNTMTASATGLTGSPVSFTATGTFAVIYNKNRGTGSVLSESAAPTEVVMLSSGGNVSGPNGLILRGWNTSPFGTGTYYPPGGAILSMPARNLTLYAVWAGSITFNNRGGILGPLPRSEIPGYVTLPAGPSKVGHDFLGWATRPNGGGQVYAAQSNFYLGTVNVTLYAKWS